MSKDNATVAPIAELNITDLRRQIEDAQADAASWEADLHEATEKIRKLESELQSRAGHVVPEEYEEHNAKREAMINAIRCKLRRREKKLTEQSTVVYRLQKENAELTADLAEAKETISEQIKELNNANDRIAEHAQELVRLRGDSQVYYETSLDNGTQLVEILGDFKALNQKLKDATAESAQTSQTISHLTEQVDTLDRLLDQQYHRMMGVINERERQNRALQEENERLKNAERYLAPRRGYIRGALSAARAIGSIWARGGQR